MSSLQDLKNGMTTDLVVDALSADPTLRLIMTRKENEMDIRDKDFAGAEAALLRAALRAREIAAQTGTPLVIYEDGRVVKKKITYKDARAFSEEHGLELKIIIPD